MNERITLNDSPIDIMLKMSDGNPGAMAALTTLLDQSEKIDPEDFMKGYGKILMLDSFGIYGTDIYVLYSDICEKNIVNMVAVLRACQMGFISQELLKNACGRQDRSGKEMIPVKDLYKKVKDSLESFDN